MVTAVEGSRHQDTDPTFGLNLLQGLKTQKWAGDI